MHEKVVFRSAAEASAVICQICPRDGFRVDFYRRMVKSRREVFNVNDVRGSDADVVSLVSLCWSLEDFLQHFSLIYQLKFIGIVQLSCIKNFI